MATTLLTQASEAARTGDKTTARKLLTQLLKQDPHNETAWLILAGVVDEPERKRQCLERVLAINPNNRSAPLLLARLNIPQQSVPRPAVIQSGPIIKTPPPPLIKKSKSNPALIIFLLFAIVCVICGVPLIIGDWAEAMKTVQAPVPAPGFYEIRQNMTDMTEVQFKQYLKDHVIGKTADWIGWVEEVKPGAAGINQVLIDMDSPDEFFSVQDVYFDLSSSQAMNLYKDQKIAFSGRISSVLNVLTACQVNLEAVQLK